MIKLKGSASIGDDQNYTEITELEPLDAMDLVRPSMEENAFFLTTAMAITPNQTQDICDGNPNETPSCSAHDASNCAQEFYSWNSQGLYTGDCGTNQHCQLYTWCPVENDDDSVTVNNVGALTAFIKIDVTFDRYNISVSNTDDIEGTGHPV